MWDFTSSLDDVKLQKSQHKNAKSMDMTVYQSKTANQSKLCNYETIHTVTFGAYSFQNLNKTT